MTKKLSLPIKKLPSSSILTAITNLPTYGTLICNNEGLTYLNIDDNFIYKIFELVKEPALSKPNYFSQEKNFIGAHISVIYPEEQKICAPKYLHKRYAFTIAGLFCAELAGKKYYALKVKAPSLNKIRYLMDLPKKLCYKNYSIDFHITVGIISRQNKKGA